MRFSIARLAGRELSVEDAEALFAAEGEVFERLLAAADDLRRRRVGDRVTYVVNRNINFTNVCVKRCGFCAFSRGHRAEQGYFLPTRGNPPPRSRGAGSGRHRGLHSGRLAAAHAGIVLYRSVRGHQTRSSRNSRARVFARRNSLRRDAFRMQHRRVSEGAQRCGARIAAGNFCRDSGRSRARHYFSRPDLDARLDRGHPHRSQARHPDYLHDHVRPRRNRAATGPSISISCAGFKKKPAASPSSCRSASSQPKRPWSRSRWCPASVPTFRAKMFCGCTPSRV